MTPLLETQRLRLRHLVPGDAAFVLELLNDPGWLRFIGDRNVRSLEDAEGYIRDGPAAMFARHGFGLLCVERKADGARLGICGLLKRDALPDPDLGFAFLARHTGQGYGREAGAAVLDWARASLGLERIAAITQPANAASIRVLTGLGLGREGTVRLPGEDRDVELYVWQAGRPQEKEVP